MKLAEPNKCCPICGAEAYEEVGKYFVGGFKVDYCVCTGCGVMFQSPDKFFREQEIGK